MRAARTRALPARARSLGRTKTRSAWDTGWPRCETRSARRTIPPLPRTSWPTSSARQGQTATLPRRPALPGVQPSSSLPGLARREVRCRTGAGRGGFESLLAEPGDNGCADAGRGPSADRGRAAREAATRARNRRARAPAFALRGSSSPQRAALHTEEHGRAAVLVATSVLYAAPWGFLGERGSTTDSRRNRAARTGRAPPIDALRAVVTRSIRPRPCAGLAGLHRAVSRSPPGSVTDARNISREKSIEGSPIAAHELPPNGGQR